MGRDRTDWRWALRAQLADWQRLRGAGARYLGYADTLETRISVGHVNCGFGVCRCSRITQATVAGVDVAGLAYGYAVELVCLIGYDHDFLECEAPERQHPETGLVVAGVEQLLRAHNAGAGVSWEARWEAGYYGDELTAITWAGKPSLLDRFAELAYAPDLDTLLEASRPR